MIELPFSLISLVYLTLWSSATRISVLSNERYLEHPRHQYCKKQTEKFKCVVLILKTILIIRQLIITIVIEIMITQTDYTKVVSLLNFVDPITEKPMMQSEQLAGYSRAVLRLLMDFKPLVNQSFISLVDSHLRPSCWDTLTQWKFCWLDKTGQYWCAIIVRWMIVC